MTFWNKMIKNEDIIQVQNVFIQWLLYYDRYLFFLFFCMFRIVPNTHFAYFVLLSIEMILF